MLRITREGGPPRAVSSLTATELLTVGTFGEPHFSPYAHRRKYPTGSTEILPRHVRVHE